MGYDGQDGGGEMIDIETIIQVERVRYVFHYHICELLTEEIRQQIVAMREDFC